MKLVSMYTDYFPKRIHEIEKQALLNDRSAIIMLMDLERRLREAIERFSYVPYIDYQRSQFFVDCLDIINHIYNE